MLQQEMLDLKDGDQVCYIGTKEEEMIDAFPPTGTVVSRKATWLCCDDSVNFEWSIDGVSDYHFFKADELEFIKGELA